MKVPLMREAMRKIADVMMTEIDRNGFSLPMISEIMEDGELAKPYVFEVTDCRETKVFMEAAKSRLQERVLGGSTVLLLGASVLLHDHTRGPMSGNLQESMLWFQQHGVEALPGVVVCAVNRKETAADIYTKEGELATKIKSTNGQQIHEKLRLVVTFLFSGLPWPSVN